MNLAALLKRKHLAPGDHIRVSTPKQVYEGRLMPSTSHVVIKLENGYNVRLVVDAKTKVEKLPSSRTPKPKKHKHTFDPKKPPISLLAVGGTITSRVDYETGGVTTVKKPEEVLEHMPEVVKHARIAQIRSPFSIMSESVTPEHWQRLAKEVGKELRGSNKGVIVTHGTDTLHFTAAALSFMVQTPGKPVVITGSQRSTDRGSTDAAMNLTCAAALAVSDLAEVGICMHGTMDDEFCLFMRGTKVRKMHTSRRDAFRPVNTYPLARVWPDGKIKVKGPVAKRGGKPQIDTKFDDRVALLQAYPGSDPQMMNHLIKKGYRGFVIQALGMGQLPLGTKSWLPAIQHATTSGIPVFLAPQTLYGRLNSRVYAEGRDVLDAGAVTLADMLPETAYIKLGWVLGHTKSLTKIQEMMLTPVAGEITPRTLVGTFLY